MRELLAVSILLADILIWGYISQLIAGLFP